LRYRVAQSSEGEGPRLIFVRNLSGETDDQSRPRKSSRNVPHFRSM
jgi:hypothetical protein